MDENLKIEKKDVVALKVEVINQPKEKPETDKEKDDDSYYEIKVTKEEIEDIEID